MHIYGLSENYIQLKDKAQNKGATLYIDGRPKKTGNIAGFINITQPGFTLQKLLQLQRFPKFLKILDPPFNFILPGFAFYG